MSKIPKNILSTTQSLCPVCFERIPALRILINDTVYLEKSCKSHGYFCTKIWQGEESYKKWVKPKIPIERRFNMVGEDKGCPFDCGLCPNHLQNTCTAVLEITDKCNLNCKFCFADSNLINPNSSQVKLLDNIPIEQISQLLKSVYKVSPNCNLQISGGEPTLHPDLSAIVAQAKNTGFNFIQLNTNGLLLADDNHLLEKLKKAGLSSVFLQFDGTSDSVYEQLRCRKLFSIKQKAITNCIENGIGVILVPTLVPGINVNEIGNIISFGLENSPGVRGVHFQPVSYFGRYRRYIGGIDSTTIPEILSEIESQTDRITIPEILSEIEIQTSGKLSQNAFKPPSCEHSLCSFSGKFMIMEDGSLKNLVMFKSSCCTPVKAEQGSKQAIESVARQWSGIFEKADSLNQANSSTTLDFSRQMDSLKKTNFSRETDSSKGADSLKLIDSSKQVDSLKPLNKDSLDYFIQRASTHIFSVSGMAFQDVWNIDLERLKGCCIHSVSPDGRLIPFCAYNLTNRYQKGLYRKR